MSARLGEIIEKEQLGLGAEEALFRILPVCAAPNAGHLRNWIALQVRRTKVPPIQLMPFAFTEDGEAFIQRGPYHVSLWVPPAYPRYAKLYSDLLKQEYGYEGSASADGWDADHYYSKELAIIEEFELVRMGAVYLGPNRSGGSVEKAKLEELRERDQRIGKLRPSSPREARKHWSDEAWNNPPSPYLRMMDELINLKVMGFKAPTRRRGITEDHDAYCQMVADATGLPATMIRQNLADLRKRLTRPR